MQSVIDMGFTLVGLVGFPAAIAGAVSLYVAHLTRYTISEKLRSAIKYDYDQRLEAFKSLLKESGDRELERQKHSLALESNRINVQFARLQEKRASVIAEVYSALVDTYDALKIYAAAFEPVGGPSKQERFQALADNHRNFRSSFYKNRIYFPSSISERLDAINEEILGAGNTFRFAVELQQGHAEKTDAWMKVFNKIHGPIALALRELESEFRVLMGDQYEINVIQNPDSR